MLPSLSIAAVLLLGACSPADEAARPPAAPSATPSTEAKAAPVAKASASPGTPVGTAVSLESDDGVLEFSYKHPAQVGAIPALAALLEAERDKARAKARGEALADRESAKAEDYPFHPHALGIAWQVVTQTPRFLSLSNAFYTFTGGAHGNHGVEGLIWDRQAGRRLTATSLFVSPAALKAAVLKPFCAGLDAERRKKGVPPPDADGVFPRCVDPVREATVILGSTDRRRFDRVGFLMDPYVAGSYAEGEYEVTLPVTAAILATVKPEYRGEFAAR